MRIKLIVNDSKRKFENDVNKFFEENKFNIKRVSCFIVVLIVLHCLLTLDIQINLLLLDSFEV